MLKVSVHFKGHQNFIVLIFVRLQKRISYKDCGTYYVGKVKNINKLFLVLMGHW